MFFNRVDHKGRCQLSLSHVPAVFFETLPVGPGALPPISCSPPQVHDAVHALGCICVPFTPALLACGLDQGLGEGGPRLLRALLEVLQPAPRFTGWSVHDLFALHGSLRPSRLRRVSPPFSITLILSPPIRST